MACVIVTPTPIASTRKITNSVSITWLAMPKAPAAASEMLEAIHSPAIATLMPIRNSPRIGPAMGVMCGRGVLAMVLLCGRER